MSLSLSASAALAAASLLAPTQDDQALAARANQELGLLESRVLQLDLAPVDGSLSIPLEFAGVSDLIQLHPYSIRDEAEFQVLAVLADGSKRRVDVGPPRTYRGELVGQPGSQVAASLLDDGLFARIRLADGDDWWVQPLTSLVQGSPWGAHVLYSSSAVVGGHHFCGTDTDSILNFESDTTGGTYAPGPSVKKAQLGCDADFEYHNTWGGVAGATAAIETVINTMNPQYEYEVDIIHKITTILVRTSGGSPYTSTDPGVLLSQFRSEWNGPQSGIKRDVAELFTGKNLDGSVIGIAYVGVVCNKNLAYNVVQNLGSLASRTDLSAHELGHNWNAGHCSCSGFTMNPSLTTANRFHGTFTEPTIRSFRNSRNCLGDSAGTTIFQDKFESGGYTSGGWTKKGPRAVVKKQAARQGIWGAVLKRTVWIEKQVSTVGFSQVTVYFTWRTKQYEPGELIIAEYSIDGGGSWATIDSHKGPNFQNEEHILPANAAGQPDFRLRFRTTAVGANPSGKNKRGHVDVVRIIGD